MVTLDHYWRVVIQFNYSDIEWFEYTAKAAVAAAAEVDQRFRVPANCGVGDEGCYIYTDSDRDIINRGTYAQKWLDSRKDIGYTVTNGWFGEGWTHE